MGFVFPTDYGSIYRPASMDFEEGIVVFVLITVLVSICVGVPGPDPLHRIRSWSITIISCCIGGAIWAAYQKHLRHWDVNTGLEISREWESASVDTEAFLPSQGGHFRSCNITLGLHVGLRGDDNCSTFYFDEQFDWAWKQGRFGFGAYAGRFSRDFRRGQIAGYPLPVLSVAEMLLLDGEGIRWGRMYRIAGWHVHNLLWYAQGFWLLFFICLHITLAPAAYMLGMTGLLLLVSGALWLGLSPATTAVHYPTVVFAEQVLTPKPGAALGLCLATGFFSLVTAACILVIDARLPLAAAQFFGLDPLTSYDECYIEPGSNLDTETNRRARTRRSTTDIEGIYKEVPTHDSSTADKAGTFALLRRGTTRFHKKGVLNWDNKKLGTARTYDNTAFDSSTVHSE